MFWWNSDDEHEPRVIELVDGRVLLLPKGRGGKVFEVASYEAGRRLERRLVWLDRVPTFCTMLVVGAWGAYDHDWRVLLAFVPVFLFTLLADRMLLSALREATDPAARAEATRRAEPLSPWPVATGGLITLIAVFFAVTEGGTWHVVSAVFFGFLTAMGVFILVQQSGAQARPDRSGPPPPDSAPITPR